MTQCVIVSAQQVKWKQFQRLSNQINGEAAVWCHKINTELPVCTTIINMEGNQTCMNTQCNPRRAGECQYMFSVTDRQKFCMSRI